jgi:hypothetical protein
LNANNSIANEQMNTPKATRNGINTAGAFLNIALYIIDPIPAPNKTAAADTIIFR